jgi:hypothetical protein
MVKIAEERALSFEPLVHDEKTIELMEAARRVELITVVTGCLTANCNTPFRQRPS